MRKAARKWRTRFEKRAGVPDALIFLAERVPSLGYKTFRDRIRNAGRRWQRPRRL